MACVRCPPHSQRRPTVEQYACRRSRSDITPSWRSIATVVGWCTTAASWCFPGRFCRPNMEICCRVHLEQGHTQSCHDGVLLFTVDSGGASGAVDSSNSFATPGGWWNGKKEFRTMSVKSWASKLCCPCIFSRDAQPTSKLLRVISLGRYNTLRAH